MAETTDTPANASTPSAKPAAAKRPAAKKPAAAKSAKPKATKQPAAKPVPRRAAAAQSNGSGAKSSNRKQARTRFNAAIEEARAGVAALRADAMEKGKAYRRTAADSAGDWVEDARAMGEQARKRAAELAKDGKTRASDGLAALGKTVSDTAATVPQAHVRALGYPRARCRSSATSCCGPRTTAGSGPICRGTASCGRASGGSCRARRSRTR